VGASESAKKKGLKFFLNNYNIFAISIGFALSGFPQKTSNTAEMEFWIGGGKKTKIGANPFISR
jgi:hypothetical protein